MAPTILARSTPDGGIGTYLMRGFARDVALSGHRARLSLRWVGEGRYTYEVDGHRHVLTPGNFLIINDGQSYNSGSDGAVESFTLSFDAAMGSIPELPVVTRRVAGPLGALVHTLTRIGRRQVDEPDMDALFFHALDLLAGQRPEVRREIDSIAATRLATREELHRRLSRARDLMHDRAAGELTVEEMASVACLSPFHFMRTFKRAFGVSPHRYLVNLRLQRAQALMGKLPLTDVARQSGFADLSTFSKAFRARFGMAPSRFRHQG